MNQELEIGDLDVSVAPAGMSDAVGGGPCIIAVIILLTWSNPAY
jgi:hypothetical protein